MTDLLITDAVLLTVDRTDRTIDRGWLAVTGKRITGLGEGDPPAGLTPRKTVDGRGKLVMPGLVNCHLHSHEHIQKGRFDNMPMEVWQHYVRPPAGIRLGAEGVYLRTMIGILEMLHTGTTAAVDDVNHFPDYADDEIEAVFRAYEDAGMRALVSVSMLDRRLVDGIPYVGESLPQDLLDRISSVPAPDRRALLDVAGTWAERRHGKDRRVRFLVAPSAPSRCTDAMLGDLAVLAQRFDLPLFTHVSETRIQIVTGPRFYDKSIVTHLHDLGLLTPRLGAFHCVWVDDNDIGMLAEGGVSIIHSPLSNLKLGSGIAPLRKQLDAGINVALGCDGCGSNDSLNGFINMRAAALLHKVTEPDMDRWVGAREALRMATLGGAAAMGLGDCLGSLAPGMLADLTILDLQRPEYLPLNDPARQVVFCETGANVRMVLVDGETVFADGRPTKVDAPALIRAIRALEAAIAPQLAAAGQAGDELRPHMKRIYDRARAECGAWRDLPGPYSGQRNADRDGGNGP